MVNPPTRSVAEEAATPPPAESPGSAPNIGGQEEPDSAQAAVDAEDDDQEIIEVDSPPTRSFADISSAQDKIAYWPDNSQYKTHRPHLEPDYVCEALTDIPI